MPEERTFGRPFQTIAVSLIAMAAECGVVRLCLLPNPQWGAPLCLHFGVVAVLSIWLRFSPGLRSDVRIPLLLIGTTGALGPVGPLLTLIAMGLARWYMRKAIPFDEWYGALFPEAADESGNDLVRHAAHAEQDNPESLAPFADVLAFGSLHQKQALITVMSQSFRPAFGPILKRALADESNAVRVQAATAMSRLENALHAQTVELNRRVSDEPESAEALLALARHFDQLLFSSILDARREEEVREKTTDIYTRYLDKRPDDVAARIAASRLLLRGGRCAEAADALRKVIDDGAATAQAELWYMESLYRLGRYVELRDRATPRAGGEPEMELPLSAREAIELWAGKAEAAS